MSTRSEWTASAAQEAVRTCLSPKDLLPYPAPKTNMKSMRVGDISIRAETDGNNLTLRVKGMGNNHEAETFQSAQDTIFTLTPNE